MSSTTKRVRLGAALFPLFFALIFGAFLLLGMPPVATHAAGGTTYYVDSVGGNDTNSGTSQSAPWQSLAKVNSISFQPGDHILFKAGDTWFGQLMPQGSGSSGNPIVIDDYGSGSLPAINAQGTTANDGAVVRLDNQQEWEINHLDLTNPASSGDFRNGILVLASNYGTVNHIYVRNCNIHDIAAGYDEDTINYPAFTNTSPTDDIVNYSYANVGAIVFRALYGAGTTPTNFNDLQITNNTISNVYERGVGVGISSEWSNYAYGPDTPSTNILIANNSFHATAWASVNILTLNGNVGTGVIVTNNVVSDSVTDGASAANMWTQDSTGVVIEHNEVYGDTHSYGDTEAFDLDVSANNDILQDNYSHDNQGSMFMICCGGVSNTVRYNVSQNDNDGPYYNTIFIGGGSHNNAIYNNDVYEGSAIPSSETLIDVSSGSPNNVFTNNIFDTVNGLGYIIQDSTTIFDHNLFYGGHASSEPADAHKITGNPNFANPGDATTGLASAAAAYQLQSGSAAINSGTLLANNGGVDFAGNPVYGVVDVGAIAATRGTAAPVSGITTVDDSVQGSGQNQFNYSGSWSHCTDCSSSSYYGGSHSWSNATGDTVTLSFTGTQITLYGGQGNNMGYGAVSIDGGRATNVDFYANIPTEVGDIPLWTSPVLSMGTHTLTLQVTGTKDAASSNTYLVLDRVDIAGPDVQSIDDSTQFTYSGAGWGHCANCTPTSYYNGSHSWSNEAGDTATLTFTGTQITLYGGVWTDRGDGAVSIDGGSATTVDFYGNTGLDVGNMALWTSPMLSAGTHILTLTVLGTKDAASSNTYVVLDRVAIQKLSVDDSVQGSGQNQFNYSGAGWHHCFNCAPSSYDDSSHSWSDETGDTVTLTFTGTQITLYGGQWTNMGYGAVSIDGGNATNVDFYAALPTETGHILLWTSPVLTAGTHTLTLQVTGTKDAASSGTYIVLDSVLITS